MWIIWIGNKPFWKVTFFMPHCCVWRCLFTLTKTALSPKENRWATVQVCDCAYSMCVYMPTCKHVYWLAYLSADTCVWIHSIWVTVLVFYLQQLFVGTWFYLFFCICVCLCVYTIRGFLDFEALKVWINEELWLLEQTSLPRVRTPPASETIQLSLLAFLCQQGQNTNRPGNSHP